MNFDFTTRYSRTLLLLLALSVLLGGRLFLLTVVQGNSWDEASEGISTRDIPIMAPRGEIYDRYGNLIAGNKQIFTIKMSAGTMKEENLNEAVGPVTNWRTISRLLSKTERIPLPTTKKSRPG
jgi:penicillin-binding protein 2